MPLRIRAEVIILVVVATLTIPGWIAIVMRPPSRNAVVSDAPDTRDVPPHGEQVNLALPRYGTWYTASSIFTLANGDVAWLADGRFDEPYPRWASQIDHDPWVTLHFARPSAIEDVLLIGAPVTEKRQRAITHVRVRCDAGDDAELEKLDGQRFSAAFDKPLCNALTFQIGHLDGSLLSVGVLEIIVRGTQPHDAKLTAIPRPTSLQPSLQGSVP